MEQVEPHTPSNTLDVQVVVEAADGVSPEARDYAATRITHAAARAPQPVLFARVVLGLEQNPSLERPATCKAALDVSGTAVRAHVAAATPHESIDLAEARLEEALRRLSERQRADRRWQGEVEPGEWRHGARAAHRPHRSERPRDERQLLRWAADPTHCTPAAAVFEMELRDHDFELFTDADGDADSVVYRRPDGSTGLLRAGGGVAADLPAWIRPNPLEIPTLTVEDARDRLGIAGEPFVFFLDYATGRGSVVYRRFDGHDGLVGMRPRGAA
jgi:ribosome-associated translation inhibitor RaiA